MTSLSGKIAVVTGGARGIGDGIAARLVRDGARVFALDKIGPESARDGVTWLETDVTSPESVAAAFGAVDDAGGQIDILVNNAGIQRVGLVGKISFADFSSVVATHLNGFFLCASEAVPRMVKRGQGGAIVSIASTAAFVGLPGRGALLRRQGRHSRPDAGAGARSRAVEDPRQRGRAGLHPHQADRAGPRGRVAARGLDGGARADAPAREVEEIAEAVRFLCRRRKFVYDGPVDRRRRRLDRPRHSGSAGLAANRELIDLNRRSQGNAVDA